MGDVSRIGMPAKSIGRGSLDESVRIFQAGNSEAMFFFAPTLALGQDPHDMDPDQAALVTRMMVKGLCDEFAQSFQDPETMGLLKSGSVCQRLRRLSDDRIAATRN